jgi:hypothetical protein
MNFSNMNMIVSATYLSTHGRSTLPAASTSAPSMANSCLKQQLRVTK